MHLDIAQRGEAIALAIEGGRTSLMIWSSFSRFSLKATTTCRTVYNGGKHMRGIFWCDINCAVGFRTNTYTHRSDIFLNEWNGLWEWQVGESDRDTDLSHHDNNHERVASRYLWCSVAPLGQSAMCWVTTAGYSNEENLWVATEMPAVTAIPQSIRACPISRYLD